MHLWIPFDKINLILRRKTCYGCKFLALSATQQWPSVVKMKFSHFVVCIFALQAVNCQVGETFTDTLLRKWIFKNRTRWFHLENIFRGAKRVKSCSPDGRKPMDQSSGDDFGDTWETNKVFNWQVLGLNYSNQTGCSWNQATNDKVRIFSMYRECP